MLALDERRAERLRTAVLDYLEAHPDAADSVTGIQQWWLPGARVHAEKEELLAAIGPLVGQGRIRRTTLADGTQVYSRAQSRRSRW